MRINAPNQITLARLGLVVLFVLLLSWFDAARLAQQRWVLHICFWIFLAAALTDILDGLLARLLHSVTSFGRVVDPVVDKIMVCAAFVLFASPKFWDGHANITGVQPWMVIVIVARELLVSAVRSHAEGAGQEFGAAWIGKLKMFIQSTTVCVILAELAWQLDGAAPIRQACVWLTVAITVASAVSYIRRARAFLLTSAALGGRPGAAAGGPAAPPPAGDRPGARS